MTVVNAPQYLVTHSGGFHADELMSTVILTKLFPQARLIRTRDAEWITPNSDRIIYDVGRDYNVDLRIFDHHQKDQPLREDGQPLSSFGLIWRHYGHDYLRASAVPEAHIELIHRSFDLGFVLPIDLVDNGALSPSTAGPLLGDLTLPVLLEQLKPSFDDPNPNADDEAFEVALGVARTIVEARIRLRTAKMRAQDLVNAAIETAGEGHILELPQGMPYRSAVIKAEADHLLFVVNPRGDDWMINGIRASDEGFALRADLPAAWAGLTDAALEEVTGVKGAKFCHNARFIAVADSREAIMALADIAVREALPQIAAKAAETATVTV